jgi:hypothetical protein
MYGQRLAVPAAGAGFDDDDADEQQNNRIWINARASVRRDGQSGSFVVDQILSSLIPLTLSAVRKSAGRPDCQRRWGDPAVWRRSDPIAVDPCLIVMKA